MSLLSNPDYVADLRANELSSRAMERKWNIAYSAVNRHRRELRENGGAVPPKVTAKADEIPAGESESHNDDGSANYVRFSSEPWGYREHAEFIRSKGQDPDEVSFTWGWTSDPKSGGFWNKLNNVRPVVSAASIDVSAIEERVRAFRPAITLQTGKTFGSQIVVPCDLQMGKVDVNGNSVDTVEQVLNSFTTAAQTAVERRPSEIALVDAGDIIENIYSTTAQLATNDLALPQQVEAAMSVMLTGIEMLAPLTPSLKYVAVSSNHGQHRLGQKQPAGDVHADYGLVIAKMIGRALKLNPEAFGHVQIITPEPYMESLSFETSGSQIGVVHGHQAGNPDKIGEWWKGQSHGRMPTADARILICGHWHSFRVQQSGDARWIIVGPASDRGSSWFTNLKGESSKSGMLMFFTANNEWDQLQII